MTRRFIFLQSMWLSSWKITRPDKQTSRFRTFRPSKHLWRAFEQGKKRKAVIQGVQKVWDILKVINQSLVRLTFGLPTLAKPKFHLTFLTLQKVLKPAWTPCSIREGKRVLQRSSSSQKKGNFLLNLAVTAALHISSSKATF